MEKLSMKKFEKAQIKASTQTEVLGGGIERTKWTQPGTNCSGKDNYNTVSHVTSYDDGSYGRNGLVYHYTGCP